MPDNNKNVSVIFGAQVAGLVNGVNQVKEHIETISGAGNAVVSAFTGVGEAIAAAFAVEKVEQFFEHMTEGGVELKRMEEQLGMTQNEINIMSFAAENSEQKIAMLVRAFTQFSRVAEEATKGTNNQAAAFQAIGINVQQYLAQGHSVNDLLQLTIQTLGTYNDDMNKAAIISALFGGRSAQLVHVLNDLSKNHEELAAAVAKSGANVIGFESSSEHAQKAITEMDGAVKGLKERIYTDLEPAFTKTITWFTELIEKANGLLDKWDDMIRKSPLLADALNRIGLGHGSGGGMSQVEMDEEKRFWDLWQKQQAGAANGEGGKNAPIIPDLAGAKKSMDEALALQKAYLDQTLEQDKGNYEARIGAATQYFEWVKAHYGAQSKEAIQAETQITRIENQEIQKREQSYMRFFDAFNNGIRGMLTGSQSWRQTLSGMFINMIMLMIKNTEKMVATWMAGEHAKTAATVAGNAARVASDKAAGAASGGFNSANAIKTITGDAAKAYAGVYGFLSPELGPFAAIPAAASFAAVLGMEALVPSFDVGSWSVPNDTLAMVHRNEMIVPANFAEQVRSNGGFGGGDGGPTINFNGNVYGMPDFRAAVVSAVKDAKRNNHKGLTS